MLEQLRNASIVTVISLLIWALAEGQSIRQVEIQASLRLSAGSEDRAVQVQSPSGSAEAAWDGRVQIVLEGSTAAMDAIRDRIADGIDLTAGVDFQGAAGEQILDLREALRESGVLRRSGVSVARTTPEALTVRIEQLATIQAGVVVQAPDGLIAGAAVARPQLVELRVPEDEVALWGASPEVVVEISAERLGRLQPGRAQTIPTLRPAGPANARILSMDPPAVDVSLTVADRSEVIRLPSVPVHVRVSALVYNDYDVDVIDQFIPDVTIAGPSDELQKLPRTASGDPRVTAMVVLSADDLERAVLGGGEIEAEVVFSETPGPVVFRAAQTTVRLRVSRRGDELDEPAEPIGSLLDPVPGDTIPGEAGGPGPQGGESPQNLPPSEAD